MPPDETLLMTLMSTDASGRPCTPLNGHFYCMRGPPDVQAMAARADDR